MVAAIALVSSIGLVMATAQNDARASLQERFLARQEQTSRFISAYVADILAREADVASRRLAARVPTTQEFELVIADLTFEAALLLDDQGRVLQVYPRREDLIGTVVTDRYAHLASAVAGQPAVSGVVPSAAKGVPIVAFAAPFETPWGRRVLSGALDVSKTSISALLRNTTTLAGGEVRLVDARSVVAASNTESGAVGVPFAAVDTALAAVPGEAGPYDRGGQDRWFATAAVPGTPLHLVSSVPVASLYSLLGSTQWLPWLLIVALGGGSLFMIHILFALRRNRDSIEVVSQLDPLTGALNRRALSAHAARLLGTTPVAGPGLSMLMIDLDHFKAVNDAMGHDAGDVVLRAATDRIRSAVRPADFIGRWGGEEFVILLPGATLAAATQIAERVRISISATPIPIDADRTVTVTASIGCAASSGDGMAALVERADRAMYRAKAVRDMVDSSAEPLPRSASTTTDGLDPSPGRDGAAMGSFHWLGSADGRSTEANRPLS